MQTGNRENKEQQNQKDLNNQQQGVDKDPAEDLGRSEKVTSDDLKGKKVDADPEKTSDQPSR